MNKYTGATAYDGQCFKCKDGVIEHAPEIEAELKEKDKEIQERDTFLANYKAQLDRLSDQLKEKNAEIEKFKASNGRMRKHEAEYLEEIEQLKEKLCYHKESTIIINEYTSKVNEELKKLKASL